MVLDQNARRAIGATCAGVGVVALHVGVAVFFASHDPYHTTVFPPCPFLAVTGFQCPGCGGTRALYSLLHDGDLLGAARMNPLVLALYPVTLGFAGSLLAGAKRWPRVAGALSWTAFAILMAAVLYSALIRNLLP